MFSLQKRSALFWVFNTAGWLLLNLVYLVLYYRNSISDIKTITLLFITYFTGFWISILLRYFYIKINFRKLSIPLLLLTIIVGSISAAYIWFWLDILSSSPISTVIMDRYTFNNYLSHGWSNSFVTILWSALYLSLNFWFDSKEQQIKIEQANELAHSAQLQMLRYQLNPHFLFNSLNSIRALVEEDKIKAKSMITELSEFLRYSLVSRNFSNVPLRNELEAMQHYFSIEKTRYEEKLEVKFNISDDAYGFPVLSFLLHPLIENAIKYGMKSSKLPLKVGINAEVQDSKLILSISNTGKWIEPESGNNNISGTGTGLNNVRQRLENAFPNRHKFEISHSDEEVMVRIEIEK